MEAQVKNGYNEEFTITFLNGLYNHKESLDLIVTKDVLIKETEESINSIYKYQMVLISDKAKNILKNQVLFIGYKNKEDELEIH